MAVARILHGMLRRTTVVAVLVLSVLLSGACSDSGTAGAGKDDVPATLSGGLARVDDPACDGEVIGDEGASLVAAFTVRDGVPDGLCLGEPDGELDAAWDVLTSIVPADRLSDVVVVAGFDDPDTDVAAFATPVGSAGDTFAIVVNLALAAEDPGELRLTLAHEMSHVFSQTPDQLDVDVQPASCTTFHNGNGCFREGSLIDEWIARFWSDEQLAAVEAPPGEDLTGTDEPGAERRCSQDPGFPGVYAASGPEEDFAESFAAYVLGVEVPDSVQPRMDFFAEHPEFDAFRAQVADAGVDPPAGHFDDCAA